MAPHEFPEEFQCGALLSSLCDNSLQHLAFVIDGAPQIVLLAVDFHEDFVDVPPPLA